MTAMIMQRHYLREAAFSLTIARLAIRFIQPKLLFAWADRPLRCCRRFSGYEIAWVAWAVDTAGANASCLQRALAAQYMLRRRGIASEFCLGVALQGEELSAHASVKVGQDIIIGGAEIRRFSKLAGFGGKA